MATRLEIIDDELQALPKDAKPLSSPAGDNPLSHAAGNTPGDTVGNMQGGVHYGTVLGHATSNQPASATAGTILAFNGPSGGVAAAAPGAAVVADAASVTVALAGGPAGSLQGADRAATARAATPATAPAGTADAATDSGVPAAPEIPAATGVGAAAPVTGDAVALENPSRPSAGASQRAAATSATEAPATANSTQPATPAADAAGDRLVAAIELSEDIIAEETVAETDDTPLTHAGTDGDDLFFGTDAAEKFDGGEGSDTVSYANANAAVVASLSSGGTAGQARDRKSVV